MQIRLEPETCRDILEHIIETKETYFNLDDDVPVTLSYRTIKAIYNQLIIHKELTITPEDFAKRMKEITEIEDKEIAHKKADTLMIRVLMEIGYDDGAKLFHAMPKWYA